MLFSGAKKLQNLIIYLINEFSRDILQNECQLFFFSNICAGVFKFTQKFIETLYFRIRKRGCDIDIDLFGYKFSGSASFSFVDSNKTFCRSRPLKKLEKSWNKCWGDIFAKFPYWNEKIETYAESCIYTTISRFQRWGGEGVRQMCFEFHESQMRAKEQKRQKTLISIPNLYFFWKVSLWMRLQRVEGVNKFSGTNKGP